LGLFVVVVRPAFYLSVPFFCRMLVSKNYFNFFSEYELENGIDFGNSFFFAVLY